MRRAMALVTLLTAGCFEQSTPIPPKPAPVADMAKPGHVKFPDATQAITVDELTAVYAANELAGNAKFKGKRTRIAGWLRKVSTFMGDPLLTIDGPRGGKVDCFFPPDAADVLAGFKVGQFTMVECEIKGLSALESVKAHNCTWVSKETYRRFPEVIPK